MMRHDNNGHQRANRTNSDVNGVNGMPVFISIRRLPSRVKHFNERSVDPLFFPFIDIEAEITVPYPFLHPLVMHRNKSRARARAYFYPPSSFRDGFRKG